MNITFSKMRFAVVFFLMPFLGFSQSHLFTYFDKISVLNGTDSLELPWAGGFNSAQVNMAELDGNSPEEIIIVDRHSSSISIFSFEENRYVYRMDLLELLPEINPEWVIFADYNCDGKKDLFSFGQSGVVLFENTGAENGPVSWEKIADPLLTTGFSGKINLYVNPSDIPAIADIDGDGDLDILSYNFATGEDIRFHQNMAMESHGSCEMFDYVIVDREWGNFKECSCFEYAFDGQTCQDVINGRVAHTSGKSLTAYDEDGDGDKDLFLGHDDCGNLIFLENEGHADSADFNSFSTEYPSIDPAILGIYPTVKFLDVDFDGNEEMLVSSNTDNTTLFISDFANSLWLYKDQNNGGEVEFGLETKGFLQNKMLDFGEMSMPQFFDIDGDGDLDLLVAANGKDAGDEFVGRLAFLENTGASRFSPSFVLADDDFLGLSALNLQVPKFRFADFNGDGREDLFYSGYSADEFQVMSFILYDQSSGNVAPAHSVEEAESIPMPLQLFENPEFFDEDNDGDLDLLVGKRNGSLVLYENIGGNQFQLGEEDYYGIGRDFSLEKINLFAEVVDADGDGKVDLVTADRKEMLVFYDFLGGQREPEVLSLISENSQLEIAIATENYNTLAFADIFGTGYSVMVQGGSSGGLKLFRSKDEIENPGSIPLSLRIYPNPLPAHSVLTVETNKPGTLALYNLWGQQILSGMPIRSGVQNSISLPPLAQGVYIVVLETSSHENEKRKIFIR